jgi:Protein of unknown function (DUF2561)
MPYDTDSAVRSRLSAGLDPNELDRIDRILLGACAGIWLAALGAGVAATVALVDLGRGQPEPSGDSGTPWLLYTVIAISAAVIIGAVPLLLRARREALAEAEPPARGSTARPTPGRPQPPPRGVEAPTEKLRIAGTAAGRMPSGPGYATPWTHSPSLPAKLVTAVDQLWLRFAVVIACAIGIAMVVIGVATYLMAVESNAAAWVFYVLSGLVTVAMPVVPWFYLRELRAILDEPAAQSSTR